MKNRQANASLAFLTLAIIVGGSSSQGLLANMVLQILAVGLSVWVLSSAWRDTPVEGASQLSRWAVGSLGFLVCVEFVPLPPDVWPSLPGRGLLSEGFRLLRVEPHWQTISMAPWSSLAAITWSLPACATFLAVRSKRGPSFASIAVLVSVMALASLALGIEQLVTGNLYFYDITNLGTPVGLFSNVNHQADFVVCALILFLGHRATTTGGNFIGSQVPKFTSYGLVLFYIVGIILCGSVAGIGLLVIALSGTWLISNGRERSGLLALCALAALGLVSAITYVYAGAGIVDIFVDTNIPGMSRADFWRNGYHLLVHYFPFGSGLGTFANVYHLWEDPRIVDSTYVNHAHNDYLELIIETGVFGIFALIAFVAWFLSRAARLNRDEPSPSLGACLLVIAVIALHSLVDYPLRTAAISCVAAAALGFLARERPLRGSAGR